MPPEQLLPRAASAGGGDRAEAGEVVMVRRSAVVPCVTCGLCGRILRDATTVSECLHSFCRKCVFKKFKDEDTTFCPTCSTDLGCDPLEKLRTDHSLLCLRLMLFPVKRRKVEEISLLHPASVSLPFHLPQIHGVGQSGKKTDAFFMGESMNGEAEAEAAESLGMELTASPMKSSMCSRSTPAEEVGTFIVTVEKERRARAATEPTLSSEVQIAVEGSAALPPAASQRETHEVEVENTARTLEEVEFYIGRNQSLQSENARLREELEKERAEKTVAVETRRILEAERLQRESDVTQSTARMLEMIQACTGQNQALGVTNARLREELETEAEAAESLGIELTASGKLSVQAPGPSADPVVSGVVVPSSTATSESALVPPSASSVPRAWRGSVLRWSSRDDLPRHLYALDDAVEWHRWQAMHDGVAQVQAALTSALEVLANTVVPGSQALQEDSREKSDFLRRQQGLWERFNTERERTKDLSLQLGAAQGAVRDLEGREQAALEEARRAEARLQAVAEKARLDLEEFQAVVERARRDAEGLKAAAAERARRDAEELARLRGEGGALRTENDQLRLQVQGLQSALSRSADRERELKAQADGEIATLRALLDEERGEHGALRDAVCVICEDFGVAPEEGSSSLPARVLEVRRRRREIAVDALRIGVRRAFGVFGSHYSGINFAGMSEGYCAGYTEAELDEIDAGVTAPAEALAKLLEDEAVPPADPEAGPSADPEAAAPADPSAN